ncbi:hypothetical protein E4U55_003311 [Claviceps digitariae]|nr:hypothetical protein E4U55_003311 [Claviceps digitariae]
MRRLHPIYAWPLLLRTAAAVAQPGLLNVTWPAAQYSWIAVEADLPDTDSSRVRFASDSASGIFCRGRTHPSEVHRVLFPAEGGRLEFATGDGNGSTADLDSDSDWDWAVNVSFDEWIFDLHWTGLQHDPFVVARVDSDWRWNEAERSNGSICSAGLRAVDEVRATADENGRAYQVPRERLLGAQATLAVEMVGRSRRHGGSARVGDESNVPRVLRQCTYIRFVDDSDVKDTGPCGISIPSPMTLPIQSILERSDITHTASFATWITLSIVLGVASLLCLTIYLFRKRRRNRQPTEAADGPVPVYDARAVRLAQTQKLGVAPDYATATMTAKGDGSLPSYEVATGK